MSYIGKNPTAGLGITEAEMTYVKHKGDGFGELTQKEVVAKSIMSDRNILSLLDFSVSPVRSFPSTSVAQNGYDGDGYYNGLGLTIATSPEDAFKQLQGALAKAGGKRTKEVMDLASTMMKSGHADLQNKVLSALGYSFNGDPRFKGAWEKLVAGLTKGDSVLIAAAKQQYRSLLNKHVASELPPWLKKSPAMQDLLAGAQDPTALVKRLSKLSNDVLSGKFGDKLNSEVAMLAYAQTYASVRQTLNTQLLPLLSDNPSLKAVYTKVLTGTDVLADVTTDIQSLVNKYSKAGAEIDAAGIADITRMTGKFVSAVANFAALIDGSNSARKTADTIQAWAGVAVGCASAIAAGATVAGVGAIAGAAGCAIAVFTTAMTQVFSGKADPREKQSMAVFVPTSAKDDQNNQVLAVARDAYRLAAVLKQYYGFTSYAQIYERVTDIDVLNPNVGGWLGAPLNCGNCPPDRFPSSSDPNAITPGFTMVHALAALDDTTISYHGRRIPTSFVKPVLSADIALLRKKAEETIGAIEDPLSELYTVYYDVNVRAVETGANLARSDLQMNGSLMDGGGQKRNTYSETYKAFLKVDELLNLFTAISLYERKQAATKEVKYPGYWAYFATKALPIRFYAVSHSHRGEPSAGPGYSKECWTGLEGCEHGRSTGIGRTLAGNGYTGCQELKKAVAQGDVCATKELAYIRLLSAFSYMHLSYKRALDNKTLDQGGDLIKEADAATGADPALVLMRTVDPRSTKTASMYDWYYLVGGEERLVAKQKKVITSGWTTKGPAKLYAQIQARGAFFKDINKVARAQARLDNRAEMILRLTGPLDLPSEVLRSVLAGKLPLPALRGLTYANSCRSEGGVPGAIETTTGVQTICCPSLNATRSNAACIQMQQSGKGKCSSYCTSPYIEKAVDWQTYLKKWGSITQRAEEEKTTAARGKKADDARKAITTTSGNDTSGISVGTIAVAAGVALLALKFLK